MNNIRNYIQEAIDEHKKRQTRSKKKTTKVIAENEEDNDVADQFTKIINYIENYNE